jgi:DNA-binding response OmpR family regulator/DNA-binding CsgD family transcriptional regulator
MRILVAEQDQALGTFLERSFDAENYAVDLAADADAAKAMAEAQEYDAAIFDLNLAVQDGMDILRHVRSRRERLPILVLSNRSRPEERAQALDLGADDLVVKPFAFSELSARVRAMLRRGGRAAEPVLRVADLEMNRVERTVQRAGRRIDLTPKEFGLLEYLMRNVGQRVTRHPRPPLPPPPQPQPRLAGANRRAAALSVIYMKVLLNPISHDVIQSRGRPLLSENGGAHSMLPKTKRPVQPTRIYVVTHSLLFSTAVRRALKSCTFVVRVVATAEELNLLGPNDNNSLFILDRECSLVLSKRATAAINIKAPGAPKLLVGDSSMAEMCDFLSQGVQGFLPIAALDRKLTGAVEVLSQGRYFVPKSVLEHYAAYSCSRKAHKAGIEHLTSRQRQILDLLKNGSTNRQIGLALDISENTVRFHVGKLFSRTGVHDRNALIRLV